MQHESWTGRSAIEIGACSRPAEGEAIATCRFVVERWERGFIVAIAAGRADGPPGAIAADALATCVRDYGAELSLDALLALAHCELADTVGVVASIARFDEVLSRAEFSAIGNAVAVLARGDSGARPTHLYGVPGVVGRACRTPPVKDFAFERGDTLTLHTHALVDRFTLRAARSLEAQDAADTLAQAFPRTAVACVVARSLGPRAAAEGDDEGARSRTLTIRPPPLAFAEGA